MSKEYFIRWKSTVSGPFGPDRLVEMLRDGSISKHHQVSSDHATWRALQDMPEFRTACRLAPAVAESTRLHTPLREGQDAGTAGAAQAVDVSDKLRIRSVTTSLAQERWYYVQGDEAAGPVPVVGLRALVDEGLLDQESPICREGDDRWAKARDALPELWSSRREVASSRGRADARSGALAQPYFAGFWLRVCAAFIDAVLVGVLAFVAEFLVGLWMGISMAASGGGEDAITSVAVVAGAIIGTLLNWVYFAVGESSRAQATLGKRAMGLQVTDLEGARITFGRASGRYFGKFLSGLFFCVGYLMVAFTAQKRGLHDMMAGTLVVRR